MRLRRQRSQRRVLHRVVAVRFDPVLIVVELLVQPRVHHGQVVTLEVVVDVDLPVACQVPLPAHHPLHPFGVEFLRPRRDVLEKMGQWRRLVVQVAEDERAPRRDLHRQQVHILGTEVGRPLHLRRANQGAGERIGPAVVFALHRLPLAAAGRHRAGAVQADVVEAAQRLPVAHDHDRLPGDVDDDVRPRPDQLLGPRRQLPGPTEDPVLLEFEIDRIVVEARRERARRSNVGVEREMEGHAVREGDPVRRR